MSVEIGKVPALEAIENIRSKLAIPTNRWDDYLSLPRGKAFTVAGATKMDLLNDLHEDITQAIENGESITSFRKRFDQTVQKHGWSYKGKRGWRTRVIYDNNLRSAAMAGRWQQFQRTKRTRPYLMYMTVGDNRVRQQHRAWDRTVLKVDDPWWDSHYPPNGWGCRCKVVSVNERQLKRLGITPADEAPAIKKTQRVNPSTGEILGHVPDGIDTGWDNNVGAQWLGPDSAFGEHLMKLPTSVRRSALANDGLQFHALQRSFSTFAKNAFSEHNTNKVHTLGFLQDDVIEGLALKGIKPKTATLTIIDAKLKRMRRNLKTEKGIDIPLQTLMNLPGEIRNPQAVLLDDQGALLFVLRSSDTERSPKIVISVNFKKKGELSNNVRSGGMAFLRNLRTQKEYQLIAGTL